MNLSCNKVYLISFFISSTIANSPLNFLSIPSTYTWYFGIVVAKHIACDKITIGNVAEQDVEINQDTIVLSIHYDFHFKVNTINKYKVGDTSLYNGTVLYEDSVIFNKLLKMIFNIKNSIIDDTILDIFKYKVNLFYFCFLFNFPFKLLQHLSIKTIY